METDFHPDLHYRVGKSENNACHRGKGPSGYFGLAGSDCDSPLSLVNETLRWVEKNLKDKVDFVVWTGDSARHDNDDKIPRTEEEIARLNELVVEKFVDVFKTDYSPDDTEPIHSLSIPIVPTIGNNDIMPHNIFKTGPNRWTKRFLEIWNRLIPEEQRHTFVQGGWFTSEVIPGKLAVVSLNTMYFFDSNNAVDGCDAKSEPGYEQMEWLRIQLELLRERNMKAILIGHVPPARSRSKRNWDESCWQKYALWLHQYRDIVVGSVYGHMNIDHFMLQDSHKITISNVAADESPPDNDTDSSKIISVQSRTSYLASLREQWSKMPSPPSDNLLDGDSIDDWLEADSAADDDSLLEAQKSKKDKKKFLKKIGGPWAERYSVSLVSPSVVPNYFPTLRVIEYNITGLENTPTWADAFVNDNPNHELSSHPDEEFHTASLLKSDSSPEVEIDKKKKKKKKNKDKPHFKMPDPPSSTAPPGPAYSNQAFTWLSYTQYFANITKINEEIARLQELSANDLPDYEVVKAKKHDRDYFEFEVEYDTKDDDVYRMKDLTVRSFFKLASRIAKNDPTKDDVLFVSPADSSDSPLTGVDEVSTENNVRLVDNNDTEIDAQQQKKKKRRNRAWITFLNRAFVGLLDAKEIDDKLEK